MFALSSLGTWHSFSFLYFLDDLFTSNLHISIWSCPSWIQKIVLWSIFLG
jgi:hypothetical protein